jgi:hypothetical protein
MDSKNPAFTVQLLFFDGCPNTQPMQSAVETAIARLGESWVIELIDLEALPADDMRRGYGSPTILVNGVDPFGAPPPTSPSLSCRHYANGLPTADQIRDRLLALQSGEAGK